MMVAEQLIDRRIIEACQQGDRAAFQLLFETYKDKVFSIADSAAVRCASKGSRSRQR